MERVHNEQGHWMLAKTGKRVLRPGGKELTLQLLDALDISPLAGHKARLAPNSLNS